MVVTGMRWTGLELGPLVRAGSWQNSGKEKTHKPKQVCRIVPGLGGWQNFVYVFCRVIPYWGEKT